MLIANLQKPSYYLSSGGGQNQLDLKRIGFDSVFLVSVRCFITKKKKLKWINTEIESNGSVQFLDQN